MKIFVVGDITLDILCKTGNYAKPGEETGLESLDFSLGGNAANFAFAASKLGFKTELFSAIGNDFATSFLKKQLSSCGIKQSLKKTALHNACSVILVGKKGERSIYSEKGALETLSSKDIEKKLLPKLKHGNIVFFGAYFHLAKMHKGFPKLLKKIRKKGCAIAFDACFDTYGKWKVMHLLKCLDIFFLNELELEHIAKTKNKSKAVKKLFSKGASIIVLKKGAKGSELFLPDFSVSVPASKANAVDTTGAGDIFNAAFLYAFFSGASEKKSLEFANFMAGQKISKHGLFVPAGSVEILYK